MAPVAATAERIRVAALDLFAARGFDDVTVEEVAAAAGVSHMTFFRYFPTKESVVLADPYDPVIAEAVVAQDPGLPTIERVRCGFLAVAVAMGDADDAEARLRIRLAASHPRLRAASWEANQATIQAIVDALVADGVDLLEARVAAGACVGALMVALPDWGAATDDRPLGAWIADALSHLATS